VRINNPRIRVMALKKAESSDEIILRMVEVDGKPQEDVRISFAGPITAAREVNGQELPIGNASVSGGALVTSFTAYQPRTFALKLGSAPASVTTVKSQPVPLNYDLAVASNDDAPTSGGGFDGKGNALPAEMLPSQIAFHDVQFQLASAKTGTPNAIAAKGQSIALPSGALPSGHYNRIYILAAAYDGDQNGTFRVGDQSTDLTIENWGGYVGQWDTRVWKNEPDRDWAISANHASWPPPANWPKAWSPRYPDDYVGLRAGFVKPAQVGWYASHHHTAAGLNEPYQYSYLFAYSLDVPANAKTLTLPNNEKIRILAISVAQENPGVKPAQALFDTLGRTEPGELQAAAN
ncbi:MAG TPA: glycosyl hydrolase-related protein, partial [Bryobacteraceae bacterium]|nr:glycosyl hydrolase-related protein [Bryobacteraceae bacterium]